MLCLHVPSSWCSVLLQSCSYHQLSVQNIGWRVHTVSTQHLQHVSRVTCTVGTCPHSGMSLSTIVSAALIGLTP